MKVPKYIQDALKRRARAAVAWSTADRIITDFIDKHEIDVPPEDYCGGVEAIVNPWDSALSVLQAIENH